MTRKWQYTQNDGAVVEQGTDTIVFYINDVHPDVISELVEKVNDGCSITRIKSWLESDNRVQPDEIDYLIEVIEEDQKQESKVVEEVDDLPFGGSITIVLGVNSNEVPTIDEYLNTDVTQKPEAYISKSIPQEMEQVIEQPTKKTRQPRTVTTASKAKKLSPEELMSQLKDKMEIVSVLSNISQIEIPDTLSNSGKRVLLDMQKEYNLLIDKYMTIIQEM